MTVETPNEINAEYEKVFADTEGIEKIKNEIDYDTRKMESEIKRRSKGKTPEFEAAVRRNLESWTEEKNKQRKEVLAELEKERNAKLDELAHKVTLKPTGSSGRQVAHSKASTYKEVNPDKDIQRAYARAELEPLKAWFAKNGFNAKVTGRDGDNDDYNYALVVNCASWVPDAAERLRAGTSLIDDVRAVIALGSGVNVRILFPSLTDEQFEEIVGKLAGAA